MSHSQLQVQVFAEPDLVRQPSPPRRYDIDRLRVLAMLGVFFFHNARFFDPLDWHVKNEQHSTAAFVFVGFLNCWQMPLLMLLAGAGSWFALESRTTGQYLFERVKRLLVPLYTVGLFVLIPPQFYWDQLTKGRFSGSFWQFYPQFLGHIELRPGLGFLEFWSGHLWFLRSLFLYSLLSLPVLLYLKSGSGRRLIARLAERCGSSGGLFLFVIPIALVQVGLGPLWSGREHGGTESVYLLAFFIFGYILVADDRFTQATTRHGRISLILGITIFLVLAWLVLARGFKGWQTPDYSPMCVLFFTLASLNTWCWLVFFLGLAAGHLNSNSRLLAYANEAVLPFYVLHQTIILAIGRYVVSWNASIAIKYVAITTVSFAIIMVLYELLIRRHNLLRVLFGMRVLTTRRDADG